MGISERLGEAVRDFERRQQKDAAFVQLRNFYAEMIGKGLVVKKEYDLPSLDTIGRVVHETKNS